MTDSNYELVFRGELIDGFDAQQVKESFARLFKLSEERVEQIFSHPSVTLRKGLSSQQAEHYQQQLKKVGLQAHIKGAATPAAISKPDPAPQQAMAADASAVAAEAPPPQAVAQDGAEAESSAEPQQMPFSFSGNGGEYFKIWIVNILLTILTLGIYSAWAKVRNKQYFYGNSTLDGSSFVYLAKPITILKGRLIAFTIFALFALADFLGPIVKLVASLLFMGAFPWMVVKSLSFNARNSAYRNVRFGFDGGMGDAFKVFMLWPLAGVLTFGLLMPLAFQRQQKFVIDNSRYGTAGFNFEATPRDYYTVVIRLVGVLILGMLLGLAVMQFIPPIAPVIMVLLYLYAFVYFTVSITNIKFNNTLLADHGFACNFEMRSYTTLFLTNSIATVLTLGLFIPWAKVRNAQYLADHLEFVTTSDLDGFTAQEEEKVSSIGQEIGDVFDMDIGF
jgi:uncharacterized membrane protein YjgN (DUF898 family)